MGGRERVNVKAVVYHCAAGVLVIVALLAVVAIRPHAPLHAAPPPTGTPAIAQATPQPSPTIGVVQDVLNMRAGPGTDYSLMYTDRALAVGEQLEVLDEASGTGCDTWLQIRRNNGDEGWVCGDYVRVRGAAAPTSTTPSPATTTATDPIFGVCSGETLWDTLYWTF